MSRAQHTKGPWHVTDGEAVFAGPSCVAIPCDRSGEHLLLARVASTDIAWSERNANARLIAAAPELLHACEELLRAMLSADAGTETATYITTTIDHAMRFTRAAIAKAKGGAD